MEINPKLQKQYIKGIYLINMVIFRWLSRKSVLVA